jgi:hypothetical protein
LIVFSSKLLEAVFEPPPAMELVFRSPVVKSVGAMMLVMRSPFPGLLPGKEIQTSGIRMSHMRENTRSAFVLLIAAAVGFLAAIVIKDAGQLVDRRLGIAIEPRPMELIVSMDVSQSRKIPDGKFVSP